MKKSISVLLVFLFVISMSSSAKANIGDLGYFGGVSDGTALPKTIANELNSAATSGKTKSTTMQYKEIIFLTGIPTVFTGKMVVTTTAAKETNNIGSYDLTYKISSSDDTEENINIDRTIKFKITYKKEASTETISGYQLVKDAAVTSWTEIITVGGTTYTLDKGKSYYSVTANEEIAGGLTYIKNNITSRSVYRTGTAGTQVVQTCYGEGYGYNQAWSSTETQRMNVTIQHFENSTEKWQLQAQVRPSVTVNKVLSYSPNETTLTSFNGNYYEILQRQNILQYDIVAIPQQFKRDAELSGSVMINTFNEIETLRVPSALNLVKLKGNAAEEDIKQLYSMGVLNDPQYFVPAQGMTRAQFVMALVKLLKLELPQISSAKSKKTQTTEYLFQDFTSERPEYLYIKAAYNAGITIGRENGYFKPDDIITREEAYCMILRALGMQNQSYATVPVTPYVDNEEISIWAKNEVSYLTQLGIIRADEEGKVSPKELLSKGEGAALLNSVVKYMRAKMQTDYIENIIYYISL